MRDVYNQSVLQILEVYKFTRNDDDISDIVGIE